MEKIYGLRDPITDEIRYIGYTKKSLALRLKGHINQSLRENKTHKQKWIRSLMGINILPTIELIHEITDNNWQYWEIFYIAKYPNLTNGTKGGDGLEETTQLALKRSKGQLGRKFTVKHKEKLSKAKMGRIGKLCPNSKTLIAFNDNHELFFYSAKEAEQYFKSLGLKASSKNINQCLNGYLIRGRFKRKMVAGYKFKRK